MSPFLPRKAIGVLRIGDGQFAAERHPPPGRHQGDRVIDDRLMRNSPRLEEFGCTQVGQEPPARFERLDDGFREPV
jgi:hypothetical protein